MAKEWTEADLEEIAQQLSCPSGEMGIATGERMNRSNLNMTKRGFDILAIANNDTVLEIGPGNAVQADAVVNAAEGVRYVGVDISETMIQEAQRRNTGLVASNQASFVLSDGQTMPFADNSFDKILTVNTVYFWQDPVSYIAEIYRVLKPGGRFALVFADKGFMDKLPFTQYGFQTYDKSMAINLLQSAPFSLEAILEEIDHTIGNLGHPVERPIIIALAKK